MEAAEHLLHLTHSLRKTNDPTVSASVCVCAFLPVCLRVWLNKVIYLYVVCAFRHSPWPHLSPPDSC